MRREKDHDPFDDLAYERTFLPIYAIIAGQDTIGGTTGMGGPLIPPILFWKLLDDQTQPY
jgi:hypothetical protein